MKIIDNLTLTKYFESFLISLSFIMIGYFSDSQDPLFLEGKVNVSIFVISILTLFYGWSGFFSFLTIYTISLHIFYENFYLYKLLQLSALGLILYIFYFIWEKKIKESKIMQNYLNQKLSENIEAFYTLKISYDKLERAFLTKPYSLKSSLETILRFAKQDQKTAILEFLKLLRDSYQVNESLIVEFDEKGFKADPSFDETDPLIQKAMQMKKPLYIDIADNKKKGVYLFAIPLFLDEKKGFLLAVKDISFMLFNKDALFEIAVIFSYFIRSVYKKKFMALHNCYHKDYLDEHFSYELCKLRDIYTSYGINSSMIVLKSKDQNSMKKMLHIIQKQKRVIDEIETMAMDNNFVIIVLFPFSNKESVEKFLFRVAKEIRKNSKLLEQIKSSNFTYMIKDVRKNRLENLLSYKE